MLKIINIEKCSRAKNSQAVYGLIEQIREDSYACYLLNAEKEYVSWCGSRCFTDNDLAPINRTIEDVREGDKIVDTDGDVREVLTVCGQMVFATHANQEYRKDPDNYTIFTIKELMGKGYKIVQPKTEPETVEMTVAEVAEKLGLKGKLKIKE